MTSFRSSLASQVFVACALSLATFGACGSERSSDGTDGGLTSDPLSNPKGVHIREGRLEIDGKPTYLFGGEVQYFRVRDQGFDGGKTQALWRETFAKMRAAKMNLVTTYFAWDYHNTANGTWDFTGARDVDAYLDAACTAGLKVIAKPGPLITAEWPRGFGSYGAIPDFWKDQHQDALVRKADGSLLDFNSLPLGKASHQPTYLHPTYLSAVGEWFDHIVPVIKKYVDKNCVIGVQVDNETNLYWSDRFGSVDYSDTAIAHYRAFLKTRYGAIGNLSAAYGISYASFDTVYPPFKLPGSLAEDPAARDWYDAGVAYISDYLGKVRGMLEARGIHEPDVLFMTNDSPFTIVGTVANDARHIIVHDGRMKNKHGIAGFDVYPKQIPDNPGATGPLTNFPAQADYFTKLFGTFGEEYTKDADHHFAYGAELQGGFYSLPLGILPVVSPESTDQLLLKTIGHGMKAGSFYVLRGGLNVDNSSYDFQAALGLDGTERPRFAVLRRWADFLSRFGERLQWTEDVEDPIALLQDISYAAPQGGTDDDHQLMYTNEYPGLYGWLLDAGFNPRVLDATTTKSLAPYKAAFYMAPKMVSSEAAKLLVDLHNQGGMLVQFLDRGSFGLNGKSNVDVTRLADLFPVDLDGQYSWPRIPRTVGYGDLNDLGGHAALRGYWYENFWKLRPGVEATTFLSERLAFTGQNGKPIGLLFETGGAPRALIGTYLSTVYNSYEYYSDPEQAFVQRRAIARALLLKAGATPTVFVDEVRAPTWARRKSNAGAADEIYVFLENDGDARNLHLHLKSLTFGLTSAARYSVKDELNGTDFGEKTGADLVNSIEIPMTKYGARVLVITPR